MSGDERPAIRKPLPQPLPSEETGVGGKRIAGRFCLGTPHGSHPQQRKDGTAVKEQKWNRRWQWAAKRSAVPDGNGSGGPGGSAPQPDDKNQLSGQQDGQQRTADAPPASWDEVFQHERFKQLLKRAKDAESALEKSARAQEDADQAKLKEQQRFQELYEKEQQRAAKLDEELRTARQTAQDDRKRQALLEAARGHEPPFSQQALMDVTVFVDLASLEIGDDGKVKGAERAVQDLAKARPYMLSQQRQDPGSPAGRKSAGAAQPAEKRRPLTL